MCRAHKRNSVWLLSMMHTEYSLTILVLTDLNIWYRKPTEDSGEWPAYTLKDKHYISLSPTSSVKRHMLPGKMAFWNSLVSSLTEPEPTQQPIAPPTTKPLPVTLCPTGQNKDFAGESKDALWHFYWAACYSYTSFFFKKLYKVFLLVNIASSHFFLIRTLKRQCICKNIIKY